MIPRANVLESSKKSPLKKPWGWYLEPLWIPLLPLIFAWLLVALASGAWLRTTAASVVVWVFLALEFYGLVSEKLAGRRHLLFIFYFLAIAGFCFLSRWPRGTWLGIAALLVGGGVILALAEVIEVGFRNFRQLLLIQPLEPALQRRLDAGLIVSHITDIHVTETDESARLEGGAGGQGRLTAWLRLVQPLGPRYLLVSGDVTDRGNLLEWERFQERVEAASGLSSGWLLAPGNHDLASAYGDSTISKIRLYFQVQTRLCPNLMTCKGLPLTQILALAETEVAPWVEQRASQLRENYIDLMTRPPPVPEKSQFPTSEQLRRIYEKANKYDWKPDAREELLNEWFQARWDELFPLRLEDPAHGLLILVLNSVPQFSDTMAEAALGRLGKPQLERVHALLAALPESTYHVLVATHHAPFRQPGETHLFQVRRLIRPRQWKQVIKKIEEFALLAHEVKEAGQFMSLLADAADRWPEVNFFLCCGHRHAMTAGRVRRLFIFEGSSLSEEKSSAWTLYLASDQWSVWPERVPELQSAPSPSASAFGSC